MQFIMEPIGHVAKDDGDVIRLNIEPKYWDGTLEIEKFSHLIILWWATDRDNPEHRSSLLGTPPRIDGAQLSGVFANRSNARPNPICHTIVSLITVDETTHSLVIDQIDANDGTPIVDIKPYLPSSDRVDEVKVPKWFEGLIKRYTV